MNEITIILLIFSVLLPAFFVELLNTRKTKNIQFLLNISGVYLLSITALYLLPELFKYNIIENIGFYILLGFFVQLILEYFSKGIKHKRLQQKNTLSKSVLISLYIYAVIEGLTLGCGLEKQTYNMLMYGIILHKVPITVIMMVFLIQSNIKKKYIYLSLFMFAIMTPLGIYLANFFKTSYTSFQDQIIAIIIGMLLYLSTKIIFESSNNTKSNLEKVLAIIIGFFLVLISL